MKKLASVIAAAIVVPLFALANPASAAPGDVTAAARNVTLPPGACDDHGYIEVTVERDTFDTGGWLSLDIIDPAGAEVTGVYEEPISTDGTVDTYASAVFLCDDRPGTYTARGTVDYYNSQTGDERSYAVSTTFTLKVQTPSVSISASNVKVWKDTCGNVGNVVVSGISNIPAGWNLYSRSGYTYTYNQAGSLIDSNAGSFRWCKSTTGTYRATTSQYVELVNPATGDVTYVTLNRSRTFSVSYNSPYWSSVTKYGSTVKATDKRWRVTGKLARQGDASYGGRRIYLQRWTGTRWATATSCVTASTGRCSVALRPPRRSKYRWYVPATARVKADTSTTFILTRRA